MTEIVFDGDMPVELKDLVRPFLEKWLWLLPPWCRVLRVGNVVDTPTNGGYMLTHVSPEYRWARITMTPQWIEQDQGDRERGVIHEFLHVPLSPMTGLMGEAMEKTDNEPYKVLVEEQWRKAMEGAVQDLTYALMSHEPDL